MKHFGKSVVLFLSLVAFANTVAAENLLPNGSFEDGTVIPGPNDYGVNGEDGCTTEGWKGGILTTGGNTEFCPPDMADGTYGLALHYAYPAVSNEFTLAKGGTYSITFLTTSRSVSIDRCKQRVDLYVDDGSDSLLSALPESISSWNSHTAYVPLSAGRHTLSFRGTLIDGARDSSTVIDNIHIEFIPFLVTATGLPAEFLSSIQVVETDYEKLKEGRDLDAPRLTAPDGIWIATGATVTADGVSRIFTGEHFHLDPTGAENTLVVWEYSFFPFLLPNWDFEIGTSVPSQRWGVNGADATTADWIGGILTKGSVKTWTSLAMASGNYGLVLHRDYNVASNFFTVSSGGSCGLSFHYVSRNEGSNSCKLQVSVYIDDNAKPVATVLPTSTQKWDFYQGKFKVPAGRHLFRFVGTAIDGVDSSTIIDAVRLHELPRTGFMVLFK